MPDNSYRFGSGFRRGVRNAVAVLVVAAPPCVKAAPGASARPAKPLGLVQCIKALASRRWLLQFPSTKPARRFSFRLRWAGVLNLRVYCAGQRCVMVAWLPPAHVLLYTMVSGKKVFTAFVSARHPRTVFVDRHEGLRVSLGTLPIPNHRRTSLSLHVGRPGVRVGQGGFISLPAGDPTSLVLAGKPPVLTAVINGPGRDVYRVEARFNKQPWARNYPISSFRLQVVKAAGPRTAAVWSKASVDDIRVGRKSRPLPFHTTVKFLQKAGLLTGRSRGRLDVIARQVWAGRAPAAFVKDIPGTHGC